MRIALEAEGHDVFFDREDLIPGETYDSRIREAIRESDVFVFMLSPNAVDAGSYTLTETEIAESAILRPSGRVLPVVLQPVPMEQVPAYLRAVTFLEPDGNLPASVAAAVERLAQRRVRALVRRAAAIGGAVVALAAATFGWFEYAKTRDLRGADGAPLVRVPAGTYAVGDGVNDPARRIYVDAFTIDRHEVTVAQYAAFLEATGGLRPPDGWSEAAAKSKGAYPVVGVDWRDAESYCHWAGRRLPTSTEWEVAARGKDDRRYPWGAEQPDATRANFGKSYQLSAYGEGLAPVGRGRAAGTSPFGVEDLAGNVSEWVSDWYAESFPSADVRNPKGPATGDKKIIRGGGWYDAPDKLVASRRFFADPDHRSDDIGFRCGRS